MKEGPKEIRRKYLTKQVMEFNKRFPVGTPVMLRRDNGTQERTAVKHEAYVMQGHSAVAHFQNVSGCYSIEDNRVTPIAEEEEKKG